MENKNIKTLPATFFKEVEIARAEVKQFIIDRMKKLHALMPEKYDLGISVRFNTDPKFVNETYINIMNSQGLNTFGRVGVEEPDTKFSERIGGSPYVPQDRPKGERHDTAGA